MVRVVRGAELQAARNGIHSRGGPGEATASGLGVETGTRRRCPKRRGIRAHPFPQTLRDFVIIIFMHGLDSVRTAAGAGFYTFIRLALRFKHHESTSEEQQV